MSQKVYVGNLAYTITQDELREFFSPCGEISDVSIPVDRETRRARGFAFVEFKDRDAIKAAMDMTGQSLKGRTVNVSEAKERRT
jgi:cold-inducible RNA-binding protein